MKKFSILSKSSISTLRLAAVSLAACVEGIITAHTAGLRKQVHHKEDIDPSKDDLGGGKYLKVIISTSVTREMM